MVSRFVEEASSEGQHLMDPVTLAVGAGILAVGWVAGRITRRRPKTRQPRPNTCDCGHLYAMHDRTTGTCAADIERVLYDEEGSANGFQWVPCRCKQYVGTIPIDITTLDLPGFHDGT